MLRLQLSAQGYGFWKADPETCSLIRKRSALSFRLSHQNMHDNLSAFFNLCRDIRVFNLCKGISEAIVPFLHTMMAFYAHLL